MKKLALSIVIAANLIGCGGNIGSSTEQDQTSETQSRSTIERLKDFFTGSSKKILIETQPSSLIIETTREWFADHDIPDMNGFNNMAYNHCNMNDAMYQFLPPNSNFKTMTFKQVAEDMLSDENIKNATEKDLKILQTLKNVPNNQLCTRVFIIQGATPVTGWMRNEDARLDQAGSIFQGGFISSEAQKYVMERMSKVSSFKNDVIAKQKINQYLDEFAENEYEQVLEKSLKTMLYDPSRISFNYNFSDDPIQFFNTSEGWDVRGTHTGVVLKKNGADFFGNGWISGKKYSLFLENVESSSMKKSKRIEDSTNLSTIEAEKNGVGVSN